MKKMKRRYNQLLDRYYKCYDEENEVKAKELKKELYKKYATHKHCPRCGSQLLVSDLKQYKYLCLNCDENFYGIEVPY